MTDPRSVWIKNFFNICLEEFENLPPLSAATRRIYEKHNLGSVYDMNWITKVHRTAIAFLEMTPVELLYIGYLRGIEENFFNMETKPYMNVQNHLLHPRPYHYRMGDRSTEFGFDIPDLAPHHFYEWFHVPQDYIRMHEFYNLLEMNAVDLLHHGYRYGIMDGRKNTVTYPPEEINKIPTFIYPKNIASFFKQNCTGFAPAGYIRVMEEYPNVADNNVLSPISESGSDKTVVRFPTIRSPVESNPDPNFAVNSPLWSPQNSPLRSLPISPSSVRSPVQLSPPAHLYGENGVPLNQEFNDCLAGLQPDLEIVRTPQALGNSNPLRLGCMPGSPSRGPVLARFLERDADE